MGRIPRWIDDQRRKRCWIAGFLLLVLLTAVAVCSPFVRDVNEEWRSEGLAVLRELQGPASWLNDEMNLPRDIDEMSTRLDALSERLKRPADVACADVELVHRTRKGDRRAEADAIARQCSMALTELSKTRQGLYTLMSDGTNTLARLKVLASSEEAQNVETVRVVATNRCQKLQDDCARHLVLAWGYQSYLAECRAFLDDVARRRQADDEWPNIRKAHAAVVQWTDALARALGAREEVNRELGERYAALKLIPFDRVVLLDLTQRRQDNTLRKVDSLVLVGSDLCRSSSPRLREFLEKKQAAARSAAAELGDLWKTHGDYVNVLLGGTNQTTASKQLVALRQFRQKALDSVNTDCKAVQNHIELVQKSRKVLLQTSTKEPGIGNDVANDGVGHICEKRMSLVRDLDRALEGLETSIASLTNDIRYAQLKAHAIVGEITSSILAVKDGLPNWSVERRRLALEFDAILREAKKVRNDVYSIQKDIVSCRDMGEDGARSSLRARVNAAFEALKAVETNCVSGMPCSNGRELVVLMQRRDEARSCVASVRQHTQEIAEELKGMFDNGVLRRVEYVPFSAQEFASQLQQGIRHFDFALDIPNEGRHQVEVRVCFRDRLYTSAKPIDRIIVQCAVSGAFNKEGELVWEDLSRWRQDCVVVLDENLHAGMNDFSLDLAFRAEREGRGLSDVTWQFERQFEGSEPIRHCFVKFLLDGREKKNVFWVAPAPITLVSAEDNGVSSFDGFLISLLVLSIVLVLFFAFAESEGWKTGGFWISVANILICLFFWLVW